MTGLDLVSFDQTIKKIMHIRI